MFTSKMRPSTGGVVAALALLVSCNVFAAGFEKAVLWSGHYGGLGGAGTSDVQGAEGLYFNPAGIGMDHTGSQVQLDISPTYINSAAPFGGVSRESKGEFLPPYALIYDTTINDKLGFAIGSYTGGGLTSEYDGISFGGANTGTFKTDLRAYEFAAGVSYKILPKLKVGAEFRETYVTAELDAAQSPGGGFVVQQNLKHLSGWASSYRVGSMWTENTWGLGLSFRGPNDFDVKGSVDQSVNGASIATGTVSHVKSQLPLELSVGGHYDFMTHMRAYLEYAWTHYSHDRTLIIDGPAANTDVPQQWSDQHQIRLAGEYSGYSWPVRLGYVFTSRVENKSTQTPNFAPPADGHTFTVGTGHAFWGHYQADMAFEYSFAHATNVASANPAFTSGEYKADVYAVHLGLAYNF